MLRFEEVAAESRKAHESNAFINQRLEAEQQHAQQLAEKIRDLQRNEKDLKARQVQLECQLASAKEEARPQDPDTSILDGKIDDLQQQLKKVEEDRTAKEAEITRLERNMEKRNRRLADFEVSENQTSHSVLSDSPQKSYGPLKDRCEKLAAKLKETTKVK